MARGVIGASIGQGAQKRRRMPVGRLLVIVLILALLLLLGYAYQLGGEQPLSEQRVAVEIGTDANSDGASENSAE